MTPVCGCAITKIDTHTHKHATGHRQLQFNNNDKQYLISTQK